MEEAENKQNEYYEAKLKKDHEDPNDDKQEETKDGTMEVDDAMKEVAHQPSSSSSSDPVTTAGDRKPKESTQQERPEEQGVERMAKRQKAEVDPTSTNVATSAGSSGSNGNPPAAASGGGASMKRTMTDTWDADEAPEKTQKINSVCLGIGSSDKIGECTKEEYET